MPDDCESRKEKSTAQQNKKSNTKPPQAINMNKKENIHVRTNSRKNHWLGFN